MMESTLDKVQETEVLILVLPHTCFVILGKLPHLSEFLLCVFKLEIIKFTITESQGYREAMGIGDAEVKNPPADAGDTETWVQSLGREDLLEEEVATHSSILAWKVPWTEEPGVIESMGFQRHDRATEHALYKGRETGSFGGPPTLNAPVFPSLFVRLILHWKYLFASLASLRGKREAITYE